MSVLSESARFTRNKWIYSVVGVGRDAAYTLYSTFLLSYVLFTKNITAQQFATLGILLTVFRVWDAINDPIMGGIVENTRSRFGKFKPWIMIGAVMNAVILVLMFTVSLEGWKFIVFFAAMYLLWDVSWTMNDIGYWSMLPSLTVDSKRRNSIAAMANLFALTGAILANGLIPVFTNGANAIGGNAVSGYAAVAISIAAVLVVSQIVVFFGVKEARNSSAAPGEHIGLRQMFRIIFKNDQLLWVTLIMLLYNLGGTLITGFGTFYMYLTFGYNGFYVTLLVAFYAIGSVAVNALYPAAAAKYTRRRLSDISLTVSVLGYAIFFVSGLITSLGATAQLTLLCLALLLVGGGQSLFYMITTICLTNTIEYNEYKTGERNEALIFSLRPFMAKMGSALQQVIITVVYLIIGMTSLTNEISAVEQQANMGLIDNEAKNSAVQVLLQEAPESMSSMLRLAMVLLPLILLVGAYLVMRSKVKIDEKEYDRMLEEIGKRKV